MANQIIVINNVPYTGCENLYVYKIAADTEEAYTAGETVYKVPELVAVSYNVSASDTSFYANNVKKITDTTYSPTASYTLSGDDAKLDEFVFGKVKEGAALKDNLTGAPEIGVFFAKTRAKGAWTITQILKCTASKADATVDTKGESTTFQTAVTNLSPLFSEHFKTYTREFYSEESVFEGHTLDEVLNELAKNPAETFDTWPDEV
jgi:hypothetical protein